VVSSPHRMSDPFEPPPTLTGIAPLARDRAALILDLWGVLHDGQRLFPDALACVDAARAAGKRVCLLSNAPRRRETTAAYLRQLGLPSDRYDALVTSGQAVHDALRDPPDALHAALGPRFYHLGPARDLDLFVGLSGRARVERLEDADFIVVTGVDGRETVADHEATLVRGAARGLPMLCANPDLAVHIGAERYVCAGALARRYEELGGRVGYHGKPYPAVYRRCLELLGGLAPAQVLAVGDNLDTDIAGADALGIPAVLITSGIHREALGVELGEQPTPERLAAVLRGATHRPRAVLTALRW
jgi:HAD superfamily hydrolase (TIGR01459 family)